MRQVIKSACPMDCLDLCSLLVHVENGRVVKIEGDPGHPVTGGFICAKGKKHIERLYSGERVTHPMLKVGGSWKKISWDEAYGLLAEGAEPLPVYREPLESPVSAPELAKEYPFRLLTCHHRHFLHSQFHNLQQKDGPPAVEVEIHPAPAAARGIEDGAKVIVKSPRGQIEAVARLTGRVPPGVVQIYQGSWLKYGGGVNLLTPDHIPDLGLGTPYYDCLCEVQRK